MEIVHTAQLDLYEKITKLLTNYKKTPKDRFTIGYVETRLDLLEGYWASFLEKHASLISVTSEEKLKLSYFTTEVYEKCLDDYLDLKTRIKEKLNTLLSEQRSLTNAKIVDSEQTVVNQNVQTCVTTRLPAIQLPTFSGDYKDWLSFHDLYKSLVHENNTISKVNKCQYLKSSLRGEAESLVKQIQVSESNYDFIWEMLNKRYNNKRSIVNTYIGRLINQKRITNESAKAIRELLDVTSECLATLKGLGLPTNAWDDIVVYIIIQKLDPESHKLFENRIESNNDLPQWDDLSKFLEHRFRTLEAVKPKELYNPRVVPPTKSFVTEISTNTCLYCQGDHYLFKCKGFCSLNLYNRKDFIQKNMICFNCLRKGHSVKSCLQSTNCRKCGRKHHSLLHGYVETSRDSQDTQSRVTQEQVNTQAMTTLTHTALGNSNNTQSQVILATALVHVQSQRDGALHTLRALVDQGSQACLLTEAACQALGFERTPVQGDITGVGAAKSSIRARVEFNIYNKNISKPIARVSAYVLKNLTSYVPQRTQAIDWPQLRELELADPTFWRAGSIDFILGADIYADILQDGLISLKNKDNTLIAQKTTLGWLISGKSTHRVQPPTNEIHIHHAKVEIDTLLRRFWEIEENNVERTLTNVEIECENYYAKTHYRGEDGRYTVRMPLITQPPDLGDSLTLAIKRLATLERRLKSNTNLREEYNKFMNDYLQQQHMEPVCPPSIRDNTICYLPHHPVINEQHLTTKLRVVFDSSAKTSNGKSLNDNLMIGPALQNDLRDVTLRWRRHKMVIIGDIRQMFRRIITDEKDRDYQRIVWRFSEDTPVQHFRLTTVTYGTSCAPYLAIKTLRQLAEDERVNFTNEVTETVIKDFYTDDLLTGRFTVDEVIKLKQDVTNLLEKGGFALHKWASNSTEIEGAPQDTRKILGINWNGYTDKFELKVELPPTNKNVTKRTLLGDIAKIYDPAGWLSPVVVVAKALLQKLWIDKTDWDEKLPDHLVQEWQNYRDELINMPTIQLNRWIGFTPDITRVELHGFSDASTIAYSAVVYCRVVTPESITVTILEAKTKVAPVKQVSLPRLELCGAELLAKLIKRVQTALSIPSENVYAWTDATIVLAWLQRPSRYWTTFVANRVTKITNVVDKDRWHHIFSHLNPADVASRGIMPSELPNHTLWWDGPPWLYERETLPTERTCDIVEPTELEAKASIEHSVHTSVISAKKSISANIFQSDNDKCIEERVINKYSTLTELIRIVAYQLRFVNCLKHKFHTKTYLQCPKYLTVQEIKSSLLYLTKISQSNHFIKEIKIVKDNNQTKVKDLLKLKEGKKISCLNPFIDISNILRVGGRIGYSVLSDDKKHPIILSKNCKLSELIVRDAHCRTLHGGFQLMLNYIRSKFYIIGVKHVIKTVIHKCVSCCRHTAKLNNQLMGNLPKDRVIPQRPFSVSGVDFAGPITLKSFSGRGSKTTVKGYIALFICTAVKAVHLELVTSLSSEAFLAAFRRFTARRGHCHKLISDCGTNFIGASKELKELFVKSSVNLPIEIAQLLAKDGTEWQFNPAGAPHMGGLWEANIKSTKFHINRVLNDSKLTYEEYYTLLCQIECCLNSRPLAPLTDDSDFALTPGHFLIGEVPIVVPDENLETCKVPYLQRWIYLQQKLQSFWRKWSDEYLVNLQKMYKWKSVQNNIKVNDVVIIRDNRLPPSKWLLGRIVEVHPGSDDLVRVVSVKCNDTVVKRPVHKLCLLPTDD